MGRKRKSEIAQEENTSSMKIASSIEARRSVRLKGKQKTEQEHVVVLINLADDELKNSSNETATETNVEQGAPQVHQEEKPSNEDVAETNLVKGASQVHQMNTVPAVDETNVEQGASQVPLVNTVLAVDKISTGEKLDYTLRRVEEYKSKGNKSPNAGPSDGICYRSLYIEAQKKMEELIDENLELRNKLSFEQGRVEAYKDMKDEMKGLLKDAFSSLGRPNEATPVDNNLKAQPPKQKKYTKKGNGKS